MSGVSLSSPHRWGLGLLIAVALPLAACTPPQAIDRSTSSSGVDVGGAMRSGNKPPTPATTTPTTPADDPAKTPASVDPITTPSAPSDAGALDPTPPTPAATPPTPPETLPPPPASTDGGVSTPTPPPVADAGAPDVTPAPADPTLSSMPASDCAKTSAWLPDSGPYLGGEKVTHGTPKHKFECRPWPYAPWCEQIEYEPGKAGIPWIDAWIDRGICP
jgi:hypothetical protein